MPGSVIETTTMPLTEGSCDYPGVYGNEDNVEPLENVKT